MKILFAASELTPIAKVGGLGDVVGALPKALVKRGMEVSVVIPRYQFIETVRMQKVAERIAVPLGERVEYVTLLKTKLPHSPVSLYLVENKKYLSTGPGPYFERSSFAGAKREMERFAFFSKAVFELMRTGCLGADVLHANDWHTGFLVALIAHRRAELPKEAKTVFTIHNLANQGKWSYRDMGKFLFSPGEEDIFQPRGKDVNFIAEGILNADRITTVSPTYAREILTKAYGEGLERILQARKSDLIGILNGIDYTFFNPENDRLIPKRYGRKNVPAGKAANKRMLANRFSLGEGCPLFGLVSRLTPQKGIDFITKTLPYFMSKSDAQFVFLGQGAPEYESALKTLARKFPDRVGVRLGFDEALAHLIYAGSDFFLMPSRFEPCGLGQMIAMRYGTLPIVRSTGGLKDSVSHGRTGFVFEGLSIRSFSGAVKGAIDLYQKNPGRLHEMRMQAASENFDFSASAKAYERVYRELV